VVFSFEQTTTNNYNKNTIKHKNNKKFKNVAFCLFYCYSVIK